VISWSSQRFPFGVVEGAAGVVEDLADFDAAGDQVVASGVDVIDGEDQVSPTRLPCRR
jgi:hypothetical protein